MPFPPARRYIWLYCKILEHGTMHAAQRPRIMLPDEPDISRTTGLPSSERSESKGALPTGIAIAEQTRLANAVAVTGNWLLEFRRHEACCSNPQSGPVGTGQGSVW